MFCLLKLQRCRAPEEDRLQIFHLAAGQQTIYQRSEIQQFYQHPIKLVLSQIV